MSVEEIVEACAPGRLADGGLSLRLAGARVVCRPSGALWLEAARALIVADLHLEKGSAYAARGQLLPPYDTRETLDRLDGEITAQAPAMIVLLGDTFHDASARSRLAADDLVRLNRLAERVRLVWISGNHDHAGLDGLRGEIAPHASLAGLSLVHEPAPVPARGEIAGHLHPCARVRGRAGGVRRRCFVTDGERIVLPAFGALTGGLNILDAAFAPLFRRPPLAMALGADRVHAIASASLRPG
jgi:DNA ligase-associated metallophosphoesterase